MGRAGGGAGAGKVIVKIGSSMNHPSRLNLGRNFDDEEESICRGLVSSCLLLISGEGESL